MALHPTDYFRKERVFVDRETCIDNFKKFIQNPNNQDYNALFYYGIAGIGKSELQHELQYILNTEYPEMLWVSMDLENDTHRNVSTFLIALRNKIQKKRNVRFYKFNLAHAIFSKKSRPDIPLNKETYPMLKEDGFFYDILNALNETVFGSFISIPIKRIVDIINHAPGNVRRHFGELPIYSHHFK